MKHMCFLFWLFSYILIYSPTGPISIMPDLGQAFDYVSVPIHILQISPISSDHITL